MSYFSYYHQPPTRIIFLPSRQLFRARFHPFSIQILTVALYHMLSRCWLIPSMSGGVHTHFLMREHSGGTSKFIMECACLWLSIFSQITSSLFWLTDFNRIAELSISCPMFQKCDAMADFSVLFNLRFLKENFRNNL